LARVYYERLTDECASYLEGESSRQRGHTAVALVFEAGPLATADGGVRFDRIREVVEACLGDLPRLRSKLRRVPTEGHPVWVDDAEFNLDYHLRQSSLPRPGNAEQLARTTARVAAGRLDRSRPLWDCWVIEGLENGRFALVVKMHKALAVEAGSDLIAALLSASEEPTSKAVRRYRPRPAPSPLELFTAEVIRRWSPSRRLVARTLGVLSHPAKATRKLRNQAHDVLQVMGYALRHSSASPFHGRIGPHRSYRMQVVSLAQVQAVHQALGGSIHDVVLALVGGALRRYMTGRLISPVTVDLHALTPVLDASGAEAKAWAIELPLWEPKAAERLRLIREQTRRIRSGEEVASAEKLASGSEWNASKLISIGARSLHGIEEGQIAVLEAPGPQQPLYLEGARLEACFGFLPIQHSSALGVTALTYAGSLFLAFNADSDIVPDLEALSDAVLDEIAEMSKAAVAQGRPLRAVSA
jgi:diacylglycerol O-acyltransferase / wax synthase